MKELIKEPRLAADVRVDDFPELLLRTAEALESQAREIADMKAQPGGVPKAMRRLSNPPMCDQCNKRRSVGSHLKCSRARQLLALSGSL